MRLLILAALLGGTLWLIRQSLRGKGNHNEEDPKTGQSGKDLVQDPICKTYIPRDTAVVVHRGGNDHYFCSDRCAAAFQDQP